MKLIVGHSEQLSASIPSIVNMQMTALCFAPLPNTKKGD